MRCSRRRRCPRATAVHIAHVGVDFERDTAVRDLEPGGVIFGGGTGNPFFTTIPPRPACGRDRRRPAAEGNQGRWRLYRDPKKDAAARRYETLSFDEAIANNLAVLDTAAFACARTEPDLVVFNVFKPGALKRVVMGEDEGTRVTLSS